LLSEVDVDEALNVLLWSESQEDLLDELDVALVVHIKDLRELLLPHEFLKAHYRLRLPLLPQYFEARLRGLGADFGQLFICQVIFGLKRRGVLLDWRRHEIISDLFGYEPVVIVRKRLQNGTTQLEIVVPSRQLEDECVEGPVIKGLAVLVVYLHLHLEIFWLCLFSFLRGLRVAASGTRRIRTPFAIAPATLGLLFLGRDQDWLDLARDVQRIRPVSYLLFLHFFIFNGEFVEDADQILRTVFRRLIGAYSA
jgi:hypothetical protein